MKRKRNKKRKQIKNVSLDKFSNDLLPIHLLVSQKKHQQALDKLSLLAAKATSPVKKCKIISLTADTQFMLGRYEEAAQYYRTAFIAAENQTLDGRIWLRPALGEIRALLKAQKLEDAYSKARAVWDLASQKFTSFEKLLDLDYPQVEQAGVVEIGPRAIRPSTILTQTAHLFFQEGYLDTAREFYQQAVLITPNGASRARQAMAKIALAEEDFQKAGQYARESIAMGRFQAKTIASWPVLITARKKQGLDLLDTELFTSLQVNGIEPVKARSVFAIVQSLRGYGDARWKEMVAEWLAATPVADEVIAFEMSKLLLLEQKLTGEAASAIALTSKKLFNQASVSVGEAIASAKAAIQYGLTAGETNVPVSQLADSIESRFGLSARLLAVHSMALGAMRAHHHDVARDLLQKQIATLIPQKGRSQWGRDLWALARMEGLLGNHPIAAEHYLKISSEKSTPQRFQLSGLLHWFEELKKTDTPPDIADVQGQLKAILDRIDNFHLLLDMGRQLLLAGSGFEPLANIVIRDGEKDARNAFFKATEPSTALEILIHLSRRQYYDFEHASQVVQFYESLGKTKLDWLWSRDTRFWEYLSLVYSSYINQGENESALKLAQDILNDPTTPSSGLIHVGTAYANWLVSQSRLSEAVPIYDRIIVDSPSLPLAAYGYYWKALLAYKANQMDKAQKLLLQLRSCFGLKPGVSWQWVIDGKAALLLRKCGVSESKIDVSKFKAAFLEQTVNMLEADLNSLNP